MFLWKNSMLQGLYDACNQSTSCRSISIFIPCHCGLYSRALIDSSFAACDDACRCASLASACRSNSSVAQRTAGIGFVFHFYYGSAREFVQWWNTSVWWAIVWTRTRRSEVVVDHPVLCLAWRCLVFCRHAGIQEFGLNALSSFFCKIGLFLVISLLLLIAWDARMTL